MAMSKTWIVLSAFVGAGAALVTTAAVQNSRNSDQPATQAQTDGISKRVQASRSVMAEVSPGRLDALETESLRSDLSAVATKAGFNLVAAECRTQMCRATLQWDSYGAALKTGAQLAERAIPGLNCVKSIWLKEPDNPSAPYSSSLFLDCNEQRAGTADTIPVTAMTTGERR
jgi:hypothetical protein